MSISKKDKLEMLYLMKKIREFEENVESLFLNNMIPGFVHLYIGQEAIAVGTCFALNQDDYIVSTHRGHGHLIAKGGELNRMMAELFAKKDGYCKGKGGSMHIADTDLGILGANGIVGAGLTIAPGAALSALIRDSKQVVACFFGDGASNRGSFHEALNISALFNLPIVFVCENNKFGMGTCYHRHTKVEKISDRAAGYNMPGLTVDGNDVLAVYDAITNAVDRARNNEGPTLVECETYRIKGHFVGDDALHYRDCNEVDEWKEKCPIKKLEISLLEAGDIDKSELDKMKTKIKGEITEAIEFAKMSPFPSADEACEDVYTNDCEVCVE